MAYRQIAESLARSDPKAPNMASNLETLVTVFGGSGFLGRAVVRALCKRDYRIRVAVRRPELAGHLQPLGKVGQIHAVQANVRYPASVAAAMRGADVAVNLVGILAQSSAQTFDAVQAEGAGSVAQAAAAAGARMVHRKVCWYAVSACICPVLTNSFVLHWPACVIAQSQLIAVRPGGGSRLAPAPLP